jgi:ACS family hexuronate transporter-like MFS transporter
MTNSTAPSSSPSAYLKWSVCGMLLLALVLNYMDRQTLSLTITAIEGEIHTNSAQYGRLEKVFGYAFAFGGLFWGLMADRMSVRWLYPVALLGWSLAGLATGYADRLGGFITPLLGAICDTEKLAMTSDPEVLPSYLGFLVCRIVLGFFEAGQWPCALVTTQRLLEASDRSLGNSILQSGASLGAILTPIVVSLFAPPISSGEAATAAAATADAVSYVGWWRMPYVVIGALGVFWIAPWLILTRGLSLARPATHSPMATDDGGGKQSEFDILRFMRRYLALIVTVIAINMTWQYFRVWLPKMLEQFHKYQPSEVRWFVIAYYIATDVGCICAGAAVKWLSVRQWNVHRARLLVYTVCAAITALSTVAASLPKGYPLLAVLILIGFGALGLFPNYYSFAQELSRRHQGKVSGSLGFITWIVTSEMQELVGKAVDKTGSYTDAVFYIGLVPLLGSLAIFLLWGSDRDSQSTSQLAAEKA